MDGISQLEFDKKLLGYKKTIDEDDTVPCDMKEILYDKTKSIMEGLGKGTEWINEQGKLRAILSPSDKDYNISFYPEAHYSALRFHTELALAAYILLDK